MSELIRLGAINKKTNQYTNPSHANKQDEFICIDCGNDVIIRQGKIRIHHFGAIRRDDCRRSLFYFILIYYIYYIYILYILYEI